MRLENLLNILKRSVYFMIEEFLEGMYNLRKVKNKIRVPKMGKKHEFSEYSVNYLQKWVWEAA